MNSSLWYKNKQWLTKYPENKLAYKKKLIENQIILEWCMVSALHHVHAPWMIMRDQRVQQCFSKKTDDQNLYIQCTQLVYKMYIIWQIFHFYDVTVFLIHIHILWCNPVFSLSIQLFFSRLYPTRRNSQNSREFREFPIQNSRRSRGIHVVCQVGNAVSKPRPSITITLYNIYK